MKKSNNMDDFEKQIQRQPLRQIPNEWRAEILAAAKPVSRLAPHASFLSTLNHQLSTILWPHPAAWAGLATVWIFIFALNFSMRDKTPMVAEKISPPSPEMVAELRQQKLLFAELIGANDLRVADRQKFFLPKPRSERAEILAA
jgi:hypothetical protein